MTKKYVTLFMVLVFFLAGLPRIGSCFTESSKVSSNCCSPGNSNEDCVSHCTKQKVEAIKTELLRREEGRTKKPLFLHAGNFFVHQEYPPQHRLLQNRYSNQITCNLNITKIYLFAIFNHAPPSNLL